MCDSKVCGCENEVEKDEVEMSRLIDEQIKERDNVFMPVLTRMRKKLQSCGISCEIEPEEYAALSVKTDEWEASLDLISFYDKKPEENKDSVITDITIKPQSEFIINTITTWLPVINKDFIEKINSSIKDLNKQDEKSQKKSKKGKTTKRKTKSK
jgi:hypothetical protein